MATREILLQHNRPVRIAGTLRIECVAGRVWLTVAEHAVDVFLRPGESYALEWPEMALVEALDRGRGGAAAGARIALHVRPSAWCRLIDRAAVVLSSLHERMRALRQPRRGDPLAG